MFPIWFDEVFVTGCLDKTYSNERNDSLETTKHLNTQYNKMPLQYLSNVNGVFNVLEIWLCFELRTTVGDVLVKTCNRLLGSYQGKWK